MTRTYISPEKIMWGLDECFAARLSRSSNASSGECSRTIVLPKVVTELIGPSQEQISQAKPGGKTA